MAGHLRSPQHLKQASEITTLALRVNNCELACSDILSGASSERPQQSQQPSFPNGVNSSSNPLAPVNLTVVHSQNTVQQIPARQLWAWSSLFSNCMLIASRFSWAEISQISFNSLLFHLDFLNWKTMKKHWHLIHSNSVFFSRLWTLMHSLMLSFDMFNSCRLVQPIKSFEPF